MYLVGVVSVVTLIFYKFINELIRLPIIRCYCLIYQLKVNLGYRTRSDRRIDMHHLSRGTESHRYIGLRA